MATLPVVRKPKFDFTRVKKYYVADNALATYFMNSMQVIVPIGEEFFIRSVKPYVSNLKDPHLARRAKAFIGQEKVHENAHYEFWQALEAHEFDIEGFKKFYLQVIDTVEPAIKNLLGDEIALSTTVALEHYTAVMAAYLMSDKSIMLKEMQGEAHDLIAWHFAEEIEHKSVAFDVMRKVDASYLLRAGGMLFASATLFPLMTIGVLDFLRQDKEVSLPSLAENILQSGQEFLNLFSFTAEQVLDYLRPDFHPDQIDNYHLIKDFMPQEKVA